MILFAISGYLIGIVISEFGEVGKQPFYVGLELLELLDANSVRIFDVLAHVDEEVGEDLVSDKAAVVLEDVDEAETDQIVFEIFFC